MNATHRHPQGAHAPRRALLFAGYIGSVLLLGPHPVHAQNSSQTTTHDDPRPEKPRTNGSPSQRDQPRLASIIASDHADHARTIRDIVDAGVDHPDWDALVTAIARTPGRSPAALGVFIDTLRAAPTETLVAAADALASIPLPDSAHLLVRAITRNGGSPAEIERLDAALATLVGARPTGDDRRAAWVAWYDRARISTDESLAHRIALAAANRASAARADAEAATNELVAAYRRLFLGLPETEQSALVARLIGSADVSQSELGFELARRMLLSARRPDDLVRAAAVETLARPRPELRALAAELLLQLNARENAADVALALDAETNPLAAASMLSFLVRWPDPAALPAVLRWAAGDSAATDPALAAAGALVASGADADDPTRATLQRLARDRALSSPSAAVVPLLSSGRDVPTLTRLLNAKREATAVAAAGALIQWPEGVQPLLDAATTRGALFPAAADATLAHRPDAPGLTALLRLPNATDPDNLRVTANVASALAPEDLLAALGDTLPTPPPAVVAALLGHCGDQAFLHEQTTPETRTTLLTKLVSALLAIGELETASAALDNVPEQRLTPALNAMRVELALLRGDHEDAAEISQLRGVGVDVWRRALPRLADPAPAAAAALALFGDNLSDGDRAELELAANRAADGGAPATSRESPEGPQGSNGPDTRAPRPATGQT